jgi:hypothetical protein
MIADKIDPIKTYHRKDLGNSYFSIGTLPTGHKHGKIVNTEVFNTQREPHNHHISGRQQQQRP